MKSVPALTVLFITTFYSIILAAQNNANSNTEIKTSVDEFIGKKMKETGMVGIGAAIIIDKKVIWTKGYGYADRENKIPFTPSTLMNIASVSKTFTGVCIMKAVEEKKLSLDKDINDYLPFKVINPYYPGEKITLRNLATHTSGLADRYPFYTDSTYFNGFDSPESLGDFLRNYFVKGGKYYSSENFLNKKPGTYRDYSNIAAGLAGYVVETVTGKQLNKYSREHIFDPLAMTGSGWFLSEIDLTRHTKLYNQEADSIKPIQLYGLTTYPDGGVHTSVDELSKFFICLLNEGKYNQTRVLKKESVDELLRFQFTETNKPENLQLNELNSGIFWATKMNASRIGHNGSDPGVRTFMLSDLTKEIGVILFVNTSLTDQERVFFDIYNELYKYGQSIKKEKTSTR